MTTNNFEIMLLTLGFEHENNGHFDYFKYGRGSISNGMTITVNMERKGGYLNIFYVNIHKFGLKTYFVNGEEFQDDYDDYDHYKAIGELAALKYIVAAL